MTPTTPAEHLTASLRSFITDLGETIRTDMESTPPDVMVERVLAVVGLVGSAVMLLFPNRRKEAVLDVLMAAVLRFIARTRKTKVVDAD